MVAAMDVGEGGGVGVVPHGEIAGAHRPMEEKGNPGSTKIN